MFAFLNILKRSLNGGANTIGFAKIAEERRARGDVKKALKLCLDGVEKYPTYATGHYILACCYLAEGQNAEAKNSLTEALRFDPHHISALSELAGLYQFENNDAKALYYYRQALAVDPLNTRIAFLIKALTGEDPLFGEAPPAVETVFDPIKEDVVSVDEDPVEAVPVIEEAAVEEEIQFSEGPPPTVVEPDAPVTAKTDDAVVQEPDPPAAFAAVACGPWVAELFQDYLPVLAKEHHQETSEEEPWPAVAFNSVLDLSRHPDAISFDNTTTTSPQVDTITTVIEEEPPEETYSPDVDMTDEVVPAKEAVEIVEESEEEEAPASDVSERMDETETVSGTEPMSETGGEAVYGEPDDLNDVERVADEALVETDINKAADVTGDLEEEPSVAEPAAAASDDTAEAEAREDLAIFDMEAGSDDHVEESEEPASEGAAEEPAPAEELVAEDISEETEFGAAPVSELLESSAFLSDKTDNQPVQAVNEGAQEPGASEDETLITEEHPAEDIVLEDESASEVEEAPVETEPEPEEAPVIEKVSKDNYLNQFFPGVTTPASPSCAPGNTASEESVSEGPPIQNQGTDSTVAAGSDLPLLDDAPSENDDTVTAPEALNVHGETLPVERPEQIDEGEETVDRDPGEAEADALSEAIPTATLAELYVRQGLIDRAISVYLTLKEHDSTNPDIHKRLSELFVMKSQCESS